ncbi:MAG: hypothetical protein RLY99_416 [Pseudomonadota bacterium]|jgi:hypothetical protein
MSGHGHVDPSNKKIALLISILALLLAISETMSKAYQTEVLTKQIEASNLWSFFQAKTIRSTATKLTIESTQLTGKASDPKTAAAIEKWDAAAKRYDSEPETGEGRKELAVKAKQAEAARDLFMHKYHFLEIASGILQVAIVLASATIITGVSLLSVLAGGLGVISLILTGLGMFAPTLIHL